MPEERHGFLNAEGEKLAASITRPADGRVRAWALFAHCFTCTREIRAARDIARALAGEGFGVMRFDFTGLGESEGDFAETSFSSNVDDLVAAAEHMAEHLGAPQLLVGHSLGGAAVLKAAPRIASSRAVVTIATPSDPEHVAHLLEPAREEIEAKGEAEVDLAGRRFRIRKQFLDDLEKHSMERVVSELDQALLIMHAPLDDTVEIDNAATLYGWAKHPKSFVTLDGADHLLGRSEDSLYAGRIIAAWSSRYIQAEDEPEVEADGYPVVARVGEENFRTDIRAGGHGLVADEPASMGGTDLGPNPYDLLLSSLGACTAMTVRMYADRKGLPLEGVSVRLAHDRIHAEDCRDCETANGRVDRIRRELVLEGDLDDEQRQKLLEIAGKCPVHRTLHSEIVDETVLADSPDPRT